ncbi:MAG TPA: 3-hydroxyacyl-CoA dehydrogenase [Actinoplanes sp.]
MTDRRPTAVVGAGSIGLGWAVVFARAGRPVVLHDSSAEMLSRARDGISERLDELATAGLLTSPPEAVLARVTTEPELDRALAGAAWVQECIVEDLDAKHSLFTAIDRLSAPDAVLASSSSMIAASRWAGDLPGRHRCLVVHPGNPPYLLPVAELVPAPFTDPGITARAGDVLRAAGMTPVVVHGEPEGFVFNRLQGAVLREAYCLVRDGVISASDLDRVVSQGLGRRWAVIGPFTTSQLNTRGGIRRHARVMGPAYQRMGAERGQHDPWTPELVEQVALDVEARLPEHEWDEQVLRRDAALVELERARRANADLFGSFDA